ncbi:hypothetical protein CSG_15250 [Campylobacter fetus subsp. venerealis str. 84-112]|nr:hypothetical protein CSG_15250 [Campylobacter fetus subsp. venerealis str. 84-112]
MSLFTHKHKFHLQYKIHNSMDFESAKSFALKTNLFVGKIK